MTTSITEVILRSNMIVNFRKLKEDYAPAILKEGRSLHEKKMVVSSKVVQFTPKLLRLVCQVRGGGEHSYRCELEIDHQHSTTADAFCSCAHQFDCQHLSAVLFHLEENLDQILIEYSQGTNVEQTQEWQEDSDKSSLRQVIQEATHKEVARQEKKHQKELLQEYAQAARVLAQSPFFIPDDNTPEDNAQLIIVLPTQPVGASSVNENIDLQFALRLPFRSRSLLVTNAREFLDSIRYHESLCIGGKKYSFSIASFETDCASLLKMLLETAICRESKDEKMLRVAQISVEAFGSLLAHAYELAMARSGSIVGRRFEEQEPITLPFISIGTPEESLRFSPNPASVRFELDYLQMPAPKLLLKPSIIVDQGMAVPHEEGYLITCAIPGMLYRNTYYRFQPHIKCKHLQNLSTIQSLTIPEPLFGTFVENGLPELLRFAEVTNHDLLDRFVTLPFVEQLSGECDIHYLDGELEASLHFIYSDHRVPAISSKLTINDLEPFVTKQGILARNLMQEQKWVDTIFQGFTFDPAQAVYTAKTERKIVELMTEIIPQYQHCIRFNCPQNLLDQFLYDDTKFTLSLRETDHIDKYEVDLTVEGQLHGTSVALLWECIATKRAYLEIIPKKGVRKKQTLCETTGIMANKILVLDLTKLGPLIQILDEMGITQLDNHKETRPLWSLANISAEQFEGLPVTFSMSKKLLNIQQQMLGMTDFKPSPVPEPIQAVLRTYQYDGAGWLERLRNMHLNGVLADDMGLGKTLQAIIALTQYIETNTDSQSLVVCPTSLVYNWKEEFTKFNPNLKVLPIDGTPAQRKKLLDNAKEFSIIITSYSLLQKDIDIYKTISFGYCILDEAQHIKNRSTRNAKSVKMIDAVHRLILTGTPIENSLDELWSLFDFLMPGFLSSYERFVEKYVRFINPSQNLNLEGLRRKVAPFILRRMKKDVLEDLPPVSHIVYHCTLSDVQKELYHSYAASAREELSQLVRKEGFDRIQIHVLATLTRLKQICCHPAIFAKEKTESGDSAKYEMLLELLETLIESKHKTVIFSQYTRMLHIMREDFQRLGIRFEYLDGSSKNRLQIVRSFNENESVSVFLVSLKAGGAGLNLVGADTVIHYDMWWNPAVENQATDRVHRIGQKNNVSSYKLITLGTIEEKILELQKRKNEVVQQIITSDEEAISKLTWEEVLELLQT